MDDLPLGTIRVKHKLIPQIPFIIVNESDFDPETMTLYEEPPEEKAPAASTTSSTTSPAAKEEDTSKTTSKTTAK
jgi:hypothetical protein